MNFLSQLSVGFCCLILSAATSANDATTNNASDNKLTSSPDIRLDSEAVRYIQQECESFAEEDSISAEKRKPYLETCVEELSAAVKEAISQLPSIDETAISGTDKDE